MEEKTNQKNLKYFLEKIVISGGYAAKDSDKIKKIQIHLSSLLAPLMPDQSLKIVITSCKRSNSVFKTKTGKPAGIMVTFRKQKSLNLLKLLNNVTPDLNKALTYNKGNLLMGISDHKKLKLERFKTESEDYGFNIAMVFKLKTLKTSKKIPSEDVCRKVLKEIIEKIK